MAEDQYYRDLVVSCKAVKFPDGSTQSTAVSGASANIPTAGTTSPTPSVSGDAPSNIHPGLYVQDVNGNWHAQAGIDTATADGGTGFGPPDPSGTLTFFRRVYFRDNQSNTQAGKNAFVSINHSAGFGTSQTNQDRALWVSMVNPNNNQLYGMEGIQVEVDLTGAPTFQNAVDGEVTGVSVQMADYHTGNISAPAYGCNAIRAQYYREAGSGSWGSVPPTAIKAIATNVSTVAGNGAALYAVWAQTSDLTGSPSNMGGVGVGIIAPINRMTYNWGLYIGDFGSNTSDYAIKVGGGAVDLSNSPVTIKQVVINTQSSPRSASTAGTTGQLAWDQNNLYICTSGGTAGNAVWKAVSLTSI